MAGDAPRPGDRVGPYALESLLGEGGFASVWIARDPGRRAVVVKLLHAEVAMEPAVLERFEREIAVLRSLEHPGIVRLIDHDPGHARPYFVMERVVGQVLRDRLLESATMSRALTVAQVVSIVRHLADALAFAHAAGVIHRDLKPANVLLDVQDRPRLLDFGLARITGTDAHAATTLGRIMGSRYYWAPEQALGEGSSAATDQFCLATLAFELLTLRRAWVRGDADTEAPYMHVSAPLDVNRPLDILERLVSGRRLSPSAFRPDVPRAADRVLERAWAVAPGDRYADVSTFAEAFVEALGDLHEAAYAATEVRLDESTRLLESTRLIESTRLLAQPASSAEPASVAAGRPRPVGGVPPAATPARGTASAAARSVIAAPGGRAATSVPPPAGPEIPASRTAPTAVRLRPLRAVVVAIGVVAGVSLGLWWIRGREEVVRIAPASGAAEPAGAEAPMEPADLGAAEPAPAPVVAAVAASSAAADRPPDPPPVVGALAADPAPESPPAESPPAESPPVTTAREAGPSSARTKAHTPHRDAPSRPPRASATPRAGRAGRAATLEARLDELAARSDLAGLGDFADQLDELAQRLTDVELRARVRRRVATGSAVGDVERLRQALHELERAGVLEDLPR